MIIRNSPLQQLDTTTRLLSDLKAKFARQTEVASSQFEVLAPQDAPGAWEQIARFQDALADQDLYIANSKAAQGVLNSAEVVLTEASNLVVEALELSVQVSSGTFNDEDRAASAARIDAIYETVLDLANTQFDGRYLFAGTAYDVPAFSDAGVYLGNNGANRIQVGDGASVPTTLVGDDLFTSALQTLEDVAGAMRLGFGSADAVRDQLSSLELGRQTLVAGRQQVGFELVDVDDAERLALSLQLTLSETLNARVAADPIESLTKLAELQTSYEVALQVTAQTSFSSLFEFLR